MQESLNEEGRTKIKFGSIIKNRLINFFESISDRIKYFFEIILGILVISFKSKKDMIMLCFATLSLSMYNHFFIPISDFITRYGFSVKTVSNIVYLTVAFVFISIIVSNLKKTIENNVAKNLEKLEELKQKMQALLDPDKQFERLGVDILCLQVGNGLIPLADPLQEGQILPRLAALRQKLTDELGYVIPDLRIIDNSNLEENEYEIYIRNKCVARGVVFPDKIMVYPDCLEKNKYKKLKETSEINFDYKNTVVYWTDKDIAESLNIEGINSADFILNHIENIVIEQVDKILTMTTTYKYINLCYSQDYMEHVLKDLMIRLDVADIRNVLVNLVKQRISIKDITYVFEKLNDYSRSEKNPEYLAKMIKEDLI